MGRMEGKWRGGDLNWMRKSIPYPLHVITIDDEIYKSIFNVPIINYCITNIIPNMQAG